MVIEVLDIMKAYGFRTLAPFIEAFFFEPTDRAVKARVGRFHEKDGLKIVFRALIGSSEYVSNRRMTR